MRGCPVTFPPARFSSRYHYYCYHHCHQVPDSAIPDSPDWHVPMPFVYGPSRRIGSRLCIRGICPCALLAPNSSNPLQQGVGKGEGYADIS